MIRSTSLLDLVNTMDLELGGAACGMTTDSTLIHLADRVDDGRLPDPRASAGEQLDLLVTGHFIRQTRTGSGGPRWSVREPATEEESTMVHLRLVWVLSGHGWADCTVSDDRAEVEVTVSYVTAGPEELLTAVTRLVVGETECRAQFEAEPTAFRWVFHREDTNVWIRLLELADGRDHDNRGTEIWSTQQTIDVVARTVIRCFDEIVREYGESTYRGKWGEHFPRTELEALRAAWREHRGGWAPISTPSEL
ncbi:hypothetical protein [Streptomyces sp. NBC_01428]|uniref:hypothetical protein n=1 Tax=Streptomyces sp. NBC_01428 TaxID=2903861 RepID=UPI002E335D2D|nr:hypothetical protein [Streptomyces sp. NBC_01428]